MNLSEIVQSSGWKNFMAKLYGMGATVVILGALFKIQHWPGGSLMITAGLSVEAIIFFFSAFEPLHEELDWTLVYPELAGLTDTEEIEQQAESAAAVSHGGHAAHAATGAAPGGGRKGVSALEKFDSLLEKAELGPELFVKLGQGLNNLQKAAEKISDISDASIATEGYVNSMKSAASTMDGLNESVGNLSDTYKSTAETVSKSGDELASSYQVLTEAMGNKANSIEQANKSFGDQLESLNKNLSALNSVYELQLQGTNEHMKDTEKLYSGLEDMMKNLKDSVEETQKYKNEVSKLNENLASLNTIYGNMLSAMNIK